MNKFLSRALVGAALVVSMMAPVGSTAIAGDALDAPEASVNGVLIDGWDDIGDVVNAQLGTTTCTISASTPVNDENLVTGSGSVSCTKTWAKLTLTVCIHGRPAFVTNDEGWQELGCGPMKAGLNSTGMSATATVPCQPTAWRYRTHVTAEGFRADSGEPGFAGMITSSAVTYDCFL